MTTERQTDNMTTPEETVKRDDDTLATLMTLAGPRATVPLDIEHRVYDRVRNEWQRSTLGVRTLRWAVPFAMAASLVVAIAVTNNSPVVPAPVAGSIALVSGVGTTPFIVGETVHVGDVLTTEPEQGVSVRLFDDTSLRIAAESELRVDGVDEYSLIAGQVYIDTGERIYRDRRITVNTENGSATDVGTQFSVSFLGAEMGVAVREGRVDVTDSQSTYSTDAGNRLSLKAGVAAVIDQVAIDDASWDWAIALAPSFEIENKSLLDFLKWASRETGKSLVFSGDDVRLAAMGIKLHGSLANLTPIQAVESVLATTKFNYRIEARSISIDW